MNDLCRKVSTIKDARVAKFKDSSSYMLKLNTAIAKFFFNKRLKMRRLLQKHHPLKDLFCLDGITQ